jgi:hypothetical protein
MFLGLARKLKQTMEDAKNPGQEDQQAKESRAADNKDNNKDALKEPAGLAEIPSH